MDNSNVLTYCRRLLSFVADSEREKASRSFYRIDSSSGSERTLSLLSVTPNANYCKPNIDSQQKLSPDRKVNPVSNNVKVLAFPIRCLDTPSWKTVKTADRVDFDEFDGIRNSNWKCKFLCLRAGLICKLKPHLWLASNSQMRDKSKLSGVSF